MTSGKSAVPNSDNIARAVFDNGTTVLVYENHSAPVAVLDGYIPTGAAHDPVGKTGLSGFVAGMLTRGSANYDFAAFNETIESVGASLSVGSNAHVADFGTHSLSEDFPTLVEVLADVLRRPTFPEDQIELVRGQTMVGLQEREQDTRRMAHRRFYETIYGDHPYAKPVSGYMETVAAITCDDLVAQHSQRYTPDGAIIVVTGDVETGAVLDLLQNHFADWSGPAPDRGALPATFEPGIHRVEVPMADKFQSDIVIGCPAVHRDHPDYFAVRVANTILGQFGMMGRLGETVREQQGLAYYSYSTQDANLAAGTWLASAGVNPANVAQASESILHEFERLGSELVPAEELADSQAYMTGVVPLTLETNSGVAATLLNMEWHGLGLDYLERYPDLIYGVTAEDVRRVARAYLCADNYTRVVAGPGLSEG